MQGQLSIYQGYHENGRPVISKDALFVEDNLIVDGAKEHIVDMLTRIPNPSSIESEVSASYNVSNFTFRGLSLSPNRSAFTRIHKLAAASGYVITASDSIFSSLDTASDPDTLEKPWGALESLPNYEFSSVNSDFSSSVFSNNVLENPTFSATTKRLINGKFKNYSLDKDLSGVSMNRVLKLYDLNGWDRQSYLRYSPSASEFLDALELGSLARYNMEDVDGVSALIDQEYASSGDGVLYIRSFAASDEGDTSGAVRLSQEFIPATSALSPSVQTQESLGLIAEITSQFSSVSGGANSVIAITLKDETEGEYYNFSAAGSYTRNSWGGGGVPLTVTTAAPVSGTISHFVNIPYDKVNNRLRVTYQFAAHDSSDILKCYFWNSNVNFIDGWYYGHIFKEDTLRRVYNNDYATPSMYMTCSGGVGGGAAASALPLSSTTYISQSVRGLEPLKKYSANVFAVTGDVSPAADNFLDAVIIKKSSSNTWKNGQFNFLSDVRCSSIVESRLGSSYAPHPQLTRTISPDRYQTALSVRPSDLCLEVSGASSISGTFEMFLNLPGPVSGKVLKVAATGATTPNVEVSVRTSNLGANGEPLWFNFTEATWDSTSSTANAFNTDSVREGFGGYGKFTTISMHPNTLLNKVRFNSNVSGVDLIMVVTNTSTTESAFVKKLAVRSNAPGLAERVPERFDWSAVSGNAHWLVADSTASGQYTFSGAPLQPVTARALLPSTQIPEPLPLSPVCNMNSASGSIHDSKAEYQFALFNTRNANTSGAVQVKMAGMFDSATVTCMSDVIGNVFTSESYYPRPNFGIVKKTYIQSYDGSTYFPDYEGNYPGAGAKNPASGGYFNSDLNRGLTMGFSGVMHAASAVRTDLAHVFYKEDLENPDNNTQTSFTIEYQQHNGLETSGDPSTLWTAAAELEDGDLVWWDSASGSWDSYDLSAVPKNSFVNVWCRGDTDAGDLYKKTKTAISPLINIDDSRFVDKTKIRFAVSQSWAQDVTETNAVNMVTDWTFYAVASGFPAKDLPEFPAPNDTTVQTPYTVGAPFGHYGNQIQYNANLSDVTLREALGTASWCTADDIPLAISGVAVNSLANNAQVVNSDGYVYHGYLGPSGTGANAVHLSGFTFETSDLGGGSSGIVVTYDVSSDDMEFFNYQGGLGAIGLWTFDIGNTYKKLVDNGHALSSIYDTSSVPAGSLYTLSDDTRNPVFKLFSKKTFRNPVKFVTGANNFIRLQWVIEFT